ncbi:hypothetical protein [Streptomyces chrestomyceticus]|uniref:hypothetical protein n=1 Tax=Streptomyces chrestomyceticus TaxID=68185 RepID=UPI0033FE775C
MKYFMLLDGWVSDHPTTALAVVTFACVFTGIVLCRRLQDTAQQAAAPAAGEGGRRKFSAGTIAAVLAFIVCTSVSLDTSYGFTADGLGMTEPAERVLSCAAFEMLIAMCVLGARERMAAEGSPGWYGSAVWVFAALSSIPAWHEGGGLTMGTLVRIIVGSFGSALAAHSALGLDLRHRTGEESQTAAAQILRDLRERLMALLGLAHRNLTAQQITEGRAMDRAVDLAHRHHAMKDTDGWRGRRLQAKLARAQDRAGCALDEERRAIYRARVAQRVYAGQLHITEADSPWTGVSPAARQEAEDLRERIEAAAEEAERQLLAAFPYEPDEAPTDADQCTELPTVSALGTAAAGQPQDPPRITVRIDQQDDEAAETCVPAVDPETAARVLALPTKRDQLTALYEAYVSADDDRTTNAIARDLTARLASLGITYSRGPANGVIQELRDAARTPAMSGTAQ